MDPMDPEKIFQAAERARNGSRFAEAERLYLTILKAPRPSVLDRAEALLGAADVARLQGKFGDSLSRYKHALVLFGKVGSPRVVDTQTGLALALRAMGRPREALTLLRKALGHYQADGDAEGIAFAHWALGGTWRIAGDLRKGWSELGLALAAYRDLKDREGEAYACCALGGLARMRCDLDASRHYYGKANALMRRRKDLFGTAYSYCGIGNVHRMEGDFPRALAYFKRAEGLYSRIGDIVSYAYTLWSMGTARKMQGRLGEAAEKFGEAQKLFLKTGDTRGQVYALLGFAEILRLTGQEGRAGKLLKTAAALCRKGRFSWEALHVRAVSSPESSQPLYRKAGSAFSPKTLPLNFP